MDVPGSENLYFYASYNLYSVPFLFLTYTWYIFIPFWKGSSYPDLILFVCSRIKLQQIRMSSPIKLQVWSAYKFVHPSILFLYSNFLTAILSIWLNLYFLPTPDRPAPLLRSACIEKSLFSVELKRSWGKFVFAFIWTICLYLYFITINFFIFLFSFYYQN